MDWKLFVPASMDAPEYRAENGTFTLKFPDDRGAAFIEKELGFTADALAPHLPVPIPGTDHNKLQLLPHVHGTDGFFLARFVKN